MASSRVRLFAPGAGIGLRRGRAIWSLAYYMLRALSAIVNRPGRRPRQETPPHDQPHRHPRLQSAAAQPPRSAGQAPQRHPAAEDFAIDEADRPEPGEGEFLVRTLYLSVDPAQRGWAAAEANYSAPVPLGSPMRALAVGVVVQSRAAGVSEGEYLYGWFGWQDYAA